VVGVPLEDIGTEHDAGAVNVLYGSAAGLQSDAPAAQFWSQDSPGVPDRSEAGDYFGRALAIGDFDGDGFGDAALSSRLEDVQGVSNAGAANVLYGSAAGLQAQSPPAQFWSQASPGVQGEPGKADHFSFSMAAADFDLDGRADLALGVEHETVDGAAQAGAVAVLFGSASGLQADAPEDQLWAQGTDGVQDLAEPGDLFGFDVAADDFDGNGVADLVIGVPREDGVAVDTGAVAVLYSVPGVGPQAVSPDDQLWDQDSPGVMDEGSLGDEIGYRVS
jgi:FG-GAP repeat